MIINLIDQKTQTMINNIKEKNLSYTVYGNNLCKNLWYVDNINKICITFTPRGGCSIAFQQYLDLVGLLKDGLEYNTHIHKYRCNIFHRNISYIPINDLIKKKYSFIKFIMNPYIRAVTIFRNQSEYNLSFREYLKLLVNNEIIYNSEFNLFHSYLQYINKEEDIITKYVKINENETHTIKLYNNELYELDVNKYSQTCIHYGIKTDYIEFCGDIVRDEINTKLPKSYKYFYDDEIKNLVYIYYKNDIDKYGFKFFDEI